MDELLKIIYFSSSQVLWMDGIKSPFPLNIGDSEDLA